MKAGQSLPKTSSFEKYITGDYLSCISVVIRKNVADCWQNLDTIDARAVANPSRVPTISPLSIQTKAFFSTDVRRDAE